MANDHNLTFICIASKQFMYLVAIHVHFYEYIFVNTFLKLISLLSQCLTSQPGYLFTAAQLISLYGYCTDLRSPRPCGSN